MEDLIKIQNELKVPKGNLNKFGLIINFEV